MPAKSSNSFQGFFKLDGPIYAAEPLIQASPDASVPNQALGRPRKARGKAKANTYDQNLSQFGSQTPVSSRPEVPLPTPSTPSTSLSTPVYKMPIFDSLLTMNEKLYENQMSPPQNLYQ